MTSISNLPPWLCGVIIVSIFVVLAIVGLLIFWRFVAGRLRLTEEMNNDIIFFASAIGVFYSLTVGLIAVGVWTAYTGVEDIVSAEATALGVSTATLAATQTQRADSFKCRSATTPFSSLTTHGR